MSSRVNYFYNSLLMHVLNYRQFTIVPIRSFRFNVYPIFRNRQWDSSSKMYDTNRNSIL